MFVALAQKKTDVILRALQYVRYLEEEMPPKTKFSQEVVLDAAYELAREQGFSALSTRSIADRLGSSTAPIYSCYPSMEDLVAAVFDRAKQRMAEYMKHNWTAAPFLNMGIGIVMFSRDESVLFRTILFDVPELSIANPDSMEENIQMMGADPMFRELPQEAMAKILEKMSVVTYGLASVVTSGVIPNVDAKWVADWLEDIGGVIIADHFQRAGVVPPSEYVGVLPEIINPDAPPPGNSKH